MAIVPSKLHKPRLIVGNPDLLRGKFARIHRADRLAVGFCLGAVFQLVKCCGYVGKHGAACIFEVKRRVLVIVLHARPLGGVVGLILVEMCALLIIVSNAYTDKLFAGKQINRCQLVSIANIVIAKGVDFFFPAIAFYILEDNSIKPARWIVRRIQRNAEDFVLFPILVGYCLSGIRHDLVYVGVRFAIGTREEMNGAISAICTIVSAVILKINGCRCGDKALRCARVRYRIRRVRVIVVRQIILKHSIFFVGVVPVSKKNILLCVGFCRRGFLCVDGMVWRGSRIGSVRRGFVRQGWVGRGGVRIGGGSLIFCRFLGFAVIVRNRCCIVYRVSRFCSRLVRSGRGISFIRNRFQVGYNRFLRRLYTLA